MSGREKVDLSGVELVAVAKAVRVRGLKGELVCDCLPLSTARSAGRHEAAP